MVKLPILSGSELIKILRKNGFQLVGQKGSHVRLRFNYNVAKIRI